MPDVESLSTSLNIFLFLTLVNSLLSRFAVVNYPSSLGPGVSSMYFAVAFMIAFALWYGIWGAFSAYLGCMIGAGILADMPFSVNVIWSLADFWQVLIPLAAFAYFKVNIRMRTKKDVVVFFVFACLINNLAGALWGSFMLANSSLIQDTAFFMTFKGWFIGNLITTAFIVPFLLVYVTPYFQQTKSYVSGYWF